MNYKVLFQTGPEDVIPDFSYDTVYSWSQTVTDRYDTLVFALVGVVFGVVVVKALVQAAKNAA